MSKLIMIGESLNVMSFEEAYEKYRYVIKNKAYRWSRTYEYDEVYQVSLIAFWNAYRKYDTNKWPIPFIAVASKFMDYALLVYHNKHKPKFNKQTAQIKSIVSMNAIVGDSDGEGTELQDLICKDETFTQKIIDDIVFDRILAKFSKQQRLDIFDYINGYKLKELTGQKGMSSQQISVRMRQTFDKFRVLYIKEMSV